MRTIPTPISLLDKIEALDVAVEYLGWAFDRIVRVTYPDVPAETQTIRDLQVKLVAMRSDLETERAAENALWREADAL